MSIFSTRASGCCVFVCLISYCKKNSPMFSFIITVLLFWFYFHINLKSPFGVYLGVGWLVVWIQHGFFPTWPNTVYCNICPFFATFVRIRPKCPYKEALKYNGFNKTETISLPVQNASSWISDCCLQSSGTWGSFHSILCLQGSDSQKYCLYRPQQPNLLGTPGPHSKNVHPTREPGILLRAHTGEAVLWGMVLICAVQIRLCGRSPEEAHQLFPHISPGTHRFCHFGKNWVAWPHATAREAGKVLSSWMHSNTKKRRMSLGLANSLQCSQWLKTPPLSDANTLVIEMALLEFLLR